MSGVLAVAGVAYLVPSSIDLLIAAVVGAGLLAAMSANPTATITALVLLTPLQVVLLATLLRVGAPVGLVRAAGNWNELALIALLVATFRAVATTSHRLDAMDRMAVAFVGLVGGYFLLALQPVVPLFPDAPRTLLPLLTSLRSNVGFVLVFLAVRHLPLDRDDRRRIATSAMVVGAVVGGLAVVETVDTATWQRFVGNTLGVRDYAQQVLGKGGLVGYSRVTGVQVDAVRAGSLLFQAITLGFFLLLPLSLALHRWLRRSEPRLLLAIAGSGAGALLTFTRSAVLGAAVLVLSAVWALPAGVGNRRAKTLVTSAGVVASGLWLASSIGLLERFASATARTDVSTQKHLDRSLEALRVLLDRPLGLGLGTGPTTSGRTDTATSLVAENSYLQVGLEVGVVGMLLFTALLALVVVAAFRRARTVTDDGGLVGGVAAAALGLFVGGFFLHVWTNIPTSWTFWAVAGLALPAADRRRPLASSPP